MLTNFQTILPRIQYFTDLASRVEETPEEEKTGKDWFALNREYQKLRRNFAGLTEMERLPGAIFVVDPKREELMVKEANRLKIPVVALTDTNCDPEVVDYVIPGNDDAIRSIGLISRLVADAVVAGRGEEVPIEDRPLPPVIEEAQVNEEVEAAKASTNGSGSAEAQTEAPEETPTATPEAAPEGTAEDAPEPATVPPLRPPITGRSPWRKLPKSPWRRWPTRPRPMSRWLTSPPPKRLRPPTPPGRGTKRTRRTRSLG
jgi:small subunit ribosomal protein S2